MKRRGALWLAALLLPAGLALGGLLYLRHEIDPSTVKGRIIQEAQKATGREIVARNLRVRLFPDLIVSADDVRLANPAGFSRPNMLVARHLVLRIALVPLLSHQVVLRDIHLTGAHVWLEQRPDGRANWQFGARAGTAHLPGALPTPRVAPMAMRAITVLAVDADGVIAWHTQPASGRVSLSHLNLREVNASSTIALTLAAQSGADTLTATGRFGAQTHLWNPASRAPWPVDLTVQDQSGRLHLFGTFANPRALSGYDVAVTAQGPALWRPLRHWVGIAHFPHLADLTLATRLIDRAGQLDIPRLSLTAGRSDLSATIAGLHLSNLVIAAPNLDGISGTETNQISIDGRFAARGLHLAAVVGPIGRLFGRGRVASQLPIPLDISASIAGATLQTHGSVQPAGNHAGTNLTFAASVPDFPALAPLLPISLSDPGPVTLGFHLRADNTGLTLDSGHLALAALDATLTAAFRPAATPQIAATLGIMRLDLDRMAALVPYLHPAARLVRRTHHTAHATITADRILWRGVTLEGLTAQLGLALDQVTLAPVSFRLGPAGPAGDGTVRLGATLNLDPLATRITLDGHGLDLSTLTTLGGMPSKASGRLSLTLGLTTHGATSSTLLANLNGQVGFGLTRAALPPRWGLAALGRLTPLAAIAPLGPALGDPPTMPLSCLAVRATLHQGSANLDRFWLAASGFSLTAGGAINLADDQIDLAVTPRIGFGLNRFTFPETLRGPLASPQVTALPTVPDLTAPDPAPDCATLSAAALAPLDRIPDLASPTPVEQAQPIRRTPAQLLKNLFGHPPL